MFIDKFKVDSPNVKYTDSHIESLYQYDTTELVHETRDGARASQTQWFTHSGIYHSCWIVQWRGDVRSFQEPPPYGKYNLQVSNKNK
jgi:hypothetical protein